MLFAHNILLQNYDRLLMEDAKKIVDVDRYIDDDAVPLFVVASLRRIKDRAGKRRYEKELFLAKTSLILDAYTESLRRTDGKEMSERLEREYVDNVHYDLIDKNWMRDFYDNKNKSVGTGALLGSAASASNGAASTATRLRCETCDNRDVEEFELDVHNKWTCLRCAAQTKVMETGHTHQDYNRVNIIGKFVYNRVVHFQDCIKQFQGKQNCKIPDKVYEDLNRKFESYRLLIDSDNYNARYSKITPQHISTFLKELKYVKHYENVNVIYFALTNKRVADITHLEEKLVEDFKELVTLYDNIHSKDKPDQLDRKNFMNVQYILFQLLSRHGYKCKIEDFAILKTTDRKLFHDQICSNLFEILGWNFTPTF